MRIGACAVAVVWACITAWPADLRAQTPTSPPAQTAPQAAQSGTLVVTVVDQSGAVLPGAIVTVIGLEDATRDVQRAAIPADKKGLASIDGLPAGRYSVEATFPGLERARAADVRVRRGANRQRLVLPIRRLQDTVAVETDPLEAAIERLAVLGSGLTRDTIDALFDDPELMLQQLRAWGGPDTVVTVDGFEGQPLPPKSQIKSVRVLRDQFAAERHAAEGTTIEVITQPGTGALRGTARAGFQDSAMDGANPLVAKRGPAQSRTFGGSVGGTAVRERVSFSTALDGASSFTTPVGYAATSTGLVTGNLAIRSPYDFVSFSGLVDTTLPRNQLLRVAVTYNTTRRDNLGVGGYDDLERAYSSNQVTTGVRAHMSGPIGRRLFLTTRGAFNWSTLEERSTTEAPAIVVSGYFTRGGAQRTGGTTTRAFSVASDVDYVRGRHLIRVGVLVDGTRYRSDLVTNYAGTYNFANLARYDEGRPRSYTRRIGDPSLAYWNVQGAVYVQDDVRLRRNLTISPGVRYEVQTHVGAAVNLAPRLGVTWAPSASGRTTVRGSVGVFYDWLAPGVYEQALRVDGFRQREINIINPSYPDPGTVGSASPTNRFIFADELAMARLVRYSAGISHRFSPRLTAGTTVSDTRGRHLLVGRNLNAPVAGRRPDPAFSNVVEARSEGRSTTLTLTSIANVNLAPARTAAGDRAPLLWRRGLTAVTSYTLGSAWNDTDGAFVIPAVTDLADEWGPASVDVRHRFSVSVNSGAVRNLTATINFSGNSATPLTIRTGRDDNGDLVFNDRPEDVGRNSERTSPQWNSYAVLTYTLGIGPRTATAAPRARLALGARIDNVLNRPNYGGYVGVMTSPLFLKPTSTSGVRRITFTGQVSF